MRQPSTPPLRPGSWPRRSNEGELKSFRAGYDTSLPEAKSLRRDDGSGQAAIRDVASTTPLVDWPTILCEPHQVAAARADPVQKQVSGDWMTKKGLTRRGPLQKPG